MNLGKAKRAPKPPAASVNANDTPNFDEFLETLDDSDSDSDNESDNDNDENEEQESAEEGDQAQNESSEEGESDDDDEEEEDDSDNQEDEDEEGGGDDDEDLEIEEEPKLNGKTSTDDHDHEEDEDDAKSESDEDDAEQSAAEHKKSLQRLQDTDPDFFEFLKQNDAELLNFENSDEDDSGSGSEDEDEEGPVHKPPEELEEASDSEAEEERLDITAEDYQGRVAKLLKQGIVNLDVISDWENKLSTTRDLATFGHVIEALECAVYQILRDETNEKLKWTVDGSAHFNALVRLCVKHVKGFCVRYLCASNNLAASEQKFDQRPMEFKEKSGQRWTKLRSKLRIYMNTLVEYLKSMGNSEAIASILRHSRKMSGFWALLGPKSFKMLRTLINIWSQGEDSCRILAYLSIGKMAGYNPEVYLVRIYKQMYLAYVTNCKFTSANSWPAINFMRTCLSEIYTMDTASAYPIAFAFIRQLAIHLKNALTAGTSQTQAQGQTPNTKLNKKEASRIVYSWQFVHSIHVWVDYLCDPRAQKDENLKLLIYPIVQICMGTIKLIPTKRYIPLRFLIIRMLIQLQDKTGVFVPVLPLITEVLLLTDFSLKSISKFSARPLDMTCCLKADASESGYGKSISENTFELILRACKAVATELAFPEIVTPTLMQLRAFLKKTCKNPEVCKKFRTLIEKIEANSKYISDKRGKAMDSGAVYLSDVEAQKILQVQMETSKPHPPLIEFANDYLKAHEKAHAKYRKITLETREEKLIPKPSAVNRQNKNPEKSSSQILDSDEDGSDTEFKTKLDEIDEIEDEEESSPKKKSKKLKRKLEKSSETSESKVAKKKKRKLQKLSLAPEAPDELVDLEFSD